MQRSGHPTCAIDETHGVFGSARPVRGSQRKCATEDTARPNSPGNARQAHMEILGAKEGSTLMKLLHSVRVGGGSLVLAALDACSGASDLSANPGAGEPAATRQRG